jgi:hypothetical protein
VTKPTNILGGIIIGKGMKIRNVPENACCRNEKSIASRRVLTISS